VVGFASGDIPRVATNMILVKNFSVIGVVFGEHSWRYPMDTHMRLQKLIAAYSDGRLQPRVMKTYPLADGSLALAEMSGRRVVGKLVLIP
jgi:NADPH2:quinone reductase